MGFDLDNYETVEERLRRWWDAYPNSQIVTTMLHYDAKTVVFRCEGIVDGVVIATGHAEEVLGSNPVNKTSFLENCETSSTGRMIGQSPLGHKPGAKPSRQEMAKVERRAAVDDSPLGSSAAPTGLASQKQVGFIRRLAKDQGYNEEALFDLCMDRFGNAVELLTSRQAHQLIEELK